MDIWHLRSAVFLTKDDALSTYYCCAVDPTIPLGHPKDYGQPAIWYNSAKYNNRTNVAAFFKLNEKSDFGYYGNGHENEIELQRWYSYSVSSLRQNGKVSRVFILCAN